jgi:uncharacterized membrane protein YfcA
VTTGVVLIVVGLLAGMLAGSLGIGGGVIFVPVLAVVVGLDQAVAQGTSLAVIAPTAAIATYAHVRYGRVAWRAAIPVGVASIVGAAVGAQLALAANPLLLRRLFAGLLVVLATRLVVMQLRTGRTVTTGDGSEH